jgi:hypothetical protein
METRRYPARCCEDYKEFGMKLIGGGVNSLY